MVSDLEFSRKTSEKNSLLPLERKSLHSKVENVSKNSTLIDLPIMFYHSFLFQERSTLPSLYLKFVIFSPRKKIF